jgi:hypothetical protein
MVALYNSERQDSDEEGSVSSEDRYVDWGSKTKGNSEFVEKLSRVAVVIKLGIIRSELAAQSSSACPLLISVYVVMYGGVMNS